MILEMEGVKVRGMFREFGGMLPWEILDLGNAISIITTCTTVCGSKKSEFLEITKWVFKGGRRIFWPS